MKIQIHCTLNQKAQKSEKHLRLLRRQETLTALKVMLKTKSLRRKAKKLTWRQAIQMPPPGPTLKQAIQMPLQDPETLQRRPVRERNRLKGRPSLASLSQLLSQERRPKTRSLHHNVQRIKRSMTTPSFGRSRTTSKSSLQKHARVRSSPRFLSRWWTTKLKFKGR